MTPSLSQTDATKGSAAAQPAGRSKIQYNATIATMSGVVCVELSNRFAWIYRSGKQVIRLPLSQCPPPSKWSAFSFADAADAADKRGMRGVAATSRTIS